MNKAKMSQRLRLFGMAAVAVATVAATAVPARADDDHERGRRGRDWHEDRHEEHEWRPYYYGAPAYVARPVYAPPAVVYAPPPPVVYAPPVAPSVNFVFPLRF